VKDIWPAKDPYFIHAGAEQTSQAQGSCPVGAVFAASESKGTDLPALSRWIAALSNESGWDDALGECHSTGTRPDSRPTRALLLRQRTKLPALLLRLKRHGVQPYVLAASGFWDSPGIRLLMAALEAFAHPNRPLPCAILLRHFAGLSDLELHRMRRDKAINGIGDLDIESAPIEKRPKIAWLKALQTASAQGIAASLLANGNLLSIIASLDVHGVMEPPRARRNLAGFLSTLQGLPASPATAFALLNEMRGGPARGDLPATSQDADLLIQTVHASKGLEYDDVILPLLNTRKTSIRKGHLLADPGTGAPMLAWRFAEEPGKNYELISDLVESRQRRDELNLFYVAMTRAKKRLCLLIQAQKSKNVNDKDAKSKDKENEGDKSHISWAQLGKELFECHPGMLELTEPPSIRTHDRQDVHQPKTPEKPTNQPNEAFSAAAPPSLDAPYDHENLRARQEGEEMHTYLQNLLVRWEDPKAFADVLDSPPPMPNAKENAMRFLDAFESLGWRHLHRRTEMGLQGASASGTKGRADLVVWDRDCTYIIDFKNIKKLSEESKETYTQQLNRYAAAIARQDQGTPVRAWLVLLKSGEWKELEVMVSG
jgi:ATP-dependent exoDNAse (exonuclease V) beta subunit